MLRLFLSTRRSLLSPCHGWDSSPPCRGASLSPRQLPAQCQGKRPSPRKQLSVELRLTASGDDALKPEAATAHCAPHTLLSVGMRARPHARSEAVSESQTSSLPGTQASTRRASAEFHSPRPLGPVYISSGAMAPSLLHSRFTVLTPK